jgi:shikimate 5-dehydrogenase
MKKSMVVGLIGPVCVSQCRARWNAYLRSQGSPLEFQFYRTRNRDELVLRLSEMFVLERRGYVVHPDLMPLVTTLLDDMDRAAKECGRVDTIVNDGGRLIGYYLAADPVSAMDARSELWATTSTVEYVA